MGHFRKKCAPFDNGEGAFSAGVRETFRYCGFLPYKPGDTKVAGPAPWTDQTTIYFHPQLRDKRLENARRYSQEREGALRCPGAKGNKANNANKGKQASRAHSHALGDEDVKRRQQHVCRASAPVCEVGKRTRNVERDEGGRAGGVRRGCGDGGTGWRSEQGLGGDVVELERGQGKKVRVDKRTRVRRLSFAEVKLVDERVRAKWAQVNDGQLAQLFGPPQDSCTSHGTIVGALQFLGEDNVKVCPLSDEGARGVNEEGDALGFTINDGKSAGRIDETVDKIEVDVACDTLIITRNHGQHVCARDVADATDALLRLSGSFGIDGDGKGGGSGTGLGKPAKRVLERCDAGEVIEVGEAAEHLGVDQDLINEVLHVLEALCIVKKGTSETHYVGLGRTQLPHELLALCEQHGQSCVAACVKEEGQPEASGQDQKERTTQCASMQLFSEKVISALLHGAQHGRADTLESLSSRLAVDRLREGRAGEEMTEASRDSERLQDVLDILLHLGLVEERKVSAKAYVATPSACAEPTALLQRHGVHCETEYRWQQSFVPLIEPSRRTGIKFTPVRRQKPLGETKPKKSAKLKQSRNHQLASISVGSHVPDSRIASCGATNEDEQKEEEKDEKVAVAVAVAVETKEHQNERKEQQHDSQAQRCAPMHKERKQQGQDSQPKSLAPIQQVQQENRLCVGFNDHPYKRCKDGESTPAVYSCTTSSSCSAKLSGASAENAAVEAETEDFDGEHTGFALVSIPPEVPRPSGKLDTLEPRLLRVPSGYDAGARYACAQASAHRPIFKTDRGGGDGEWGVAMVATDIVSEAPTKKKRVICVT